MTHQLHLLALDGDRRRALGQQVAGRWLLPVLQCGERERAPLVAARWMASRGVIGVVAGQWLGRVARDARTMDWLIAIQLAPCRAAVPAPLSWLPLERIDPDCSLIGYQADAIRQLAQSGSIAVPGPFGTFDWIERVHLWACTAPGTPLGRPTCFRASAHEVVLGFDNGGARVYFKGLAAARASDACTMQAAARLLPDSFPRTIASEVLADGTTFWLMEGCPGVDLSGCRDADVLASVVRDIAHVQQALASSRAARTDAPRLGLSAVLADADRILQIAGQQGIPAEVASAFNVVSSLREGWTPLDLDPVNVFVHTSQIRYIDLDVHIAPQPLAQAIFMRRVLARLGANQRRDLLRAMRLACESESLETAPWNAIDLAAHVVEIVQGWRRLLRNVACGEISGPIDVMASIVAGRLRGQSMR